MTKKYDQIRDALSRVTKSRVNGGDCLLPRRVLPAVYVALASLEKYLKDKGEDAKDPNEAPDKLLPKDLFVEDPDGDWGGDRWMILSNDDLIQNGGEIDLVIPDQVPGYGPWKIHTDRERPADVRADTRVGIMYKNTKWIPGAFTADFVHTNRARSLNWSQGNGGSDILYYCHVLA